MMLAPSHPLDPNLIDFGEDYEHYIYGDDHGDVRARVDAEDYWFFSRWRWLAKPNKTGKLYFKRNTNHYRGLSFTVYLHVAVMCRTGVVQPPGHTMVDHRNGDSLFCRRYNLRWATPSMNRRNLFGQGDLDI